MDLSVCIVSWNTLELLRECLGSIDDTRNDLPLEVIVVDNASSDGSPDMVRQEFPGVRLVANADNRHYAEANNQALRKSTGRLKLLLNPDIRVHPDALQTLVRWMDAHPSAGAVAPKLVYPDGRLQYSCRAFPGPDVVLYEVLGLSRLMPRSRTFGKYRMTWWGYDEDKPVDQPMASALMLRSHALDTVGLLDEQFRMFFNDVDLCRRLWDAGWEVWFTPSATMSHHHGGATRLVRREMIAESGRSFRSYYAKHYRHSLSRPTYAAAVWLLHAAYALRLLWARARPS